MKLEALLEDLAGAILSAGNHAPDKYPTWSYDTFESTRTDILKGWSRIRELLRDTEKVQVIQHLLDESFDAFDAGDNENGRKLMRAIYNLHLESLR